MNVKQRLEKIEEKIKVRDIDKFYIFMIERQEGGDWKAWRGKDETEADYREVIRPTEEEAQDALIKELVDESMGEPHILWIQIVPRPQYDENNNRIDPVEY